MSSVSISGTLILEGNLRCDGNITVEHSGKIVSISTEIMETFFSCPAREFITGNGKHVLVESTENDVIINGIIDGNAQGFPPNFGPGANSTLLDSHGDPIPIYGATHAGLGSVTDIPGENIPTVVDEITLTTKQVDERRVTLSELPADPGNVALNVVHGGPQNLYEDFRIIGNILEWPGPGLEPFLAEGDIIRVIYEGITARTFPPPKNPYGSYEAPTSVGSGSGLVQGGAAVKLVARSGMVSVNGEVTVDGGSGDSSSETGGGSGGSVWVVAWDIDGTGAITAEGGGADYSYAGGGGGGYVSLWHESSDAYTGPISVIGKDGGTDGLIYRKPIEPFFEEKFTGQIWNTKWWETLEEPAFIDNYVEMDTTEGDARNPTVQSLFYVSGRNIHAEIDYLPSGAEPNFYSSYFLLYADELNWVGLSRKHGNLFGVYSVDGCESATGIPFDNTDVTLRLRKQDSTFSFQFYDATSTPQTILTDVVPGLANKNFCVRIGTDRPEDATTKMRIYHTALTNQDLINKYVTLSGPPTDESNVALSTMLGTHQYYGIDFYVQDQRLIWDSTGTTGIPPLEDVMTHGELLRIIYEGDASANALNAGWDNFKIFEGIVAGAETSEPVLYVDPIRGSDSSDGRRMTPLKNLFVATAWAKRGGIVVLYDGTHNPTEVVRKNLTIRSTNGGDAIITSKYSQDTTGSNWENSPVTYRSCQGLVRGLRLEDSRIGLYAEHTKDMEIRECTVSDNSRGVVFGEYSENARVLRNTVHGGDIGIEFTDQAFFPYIYGNVAYDSSILVRMNDATDAIVSSNTLDDGTSGIVFDGSSSGYVASNNITNMSNGIVISADASPVSSYNNNFFGTSVQYVGSISDSSGDIWINPQYVNAGGRDYHVISTSPDRDAGTDNYDRYYLDRDNKTRPAGSLYDIGAYEYLDGTNVDAYNYVSGTGDDYIHFGGKTDPFRTLDKAMAVGDKAIWVDAGHLDSYYLSLASQDIELNTLTVFTASEDYVVSYFMLDANDMSNKFVQIPGFISGVGTALANIAVNPVDGPAQEFGTDYTVSFGSILWDGLGMDGYLAEGDVLRIIYSLQSKAGSTMTLHTHFSNLNPDQALFVSPNGSDSTVMGGDGTNTGGNGTFERPFRTVQRAMQDSSNGDNIVVMAGEYPIFNGLNGRVIVPMEDRTGIVDKTQARYLQDLFETRTFQNHLNTEELWNLTYSPDSSASIGDGHLSMTYDGTNPVRADSIFSFSGDFDVYAEVRNAIDPIYFSVCNSDNTAFIEYNNGDYTASIHTGADTYSCWGHLDVQPAEEDIFFTDYLCITSTDVSNKFVPLSFLPEDSTDVALNIVGGVPQELGEDFYVKDGKIIWDGMSLEEDIRPGDVLRAIYRARGLSDPARLQISLRGNILTFRISNYVRWYTVHKKILDSGWGDPWKAAFYMDYPTPGESHDNLYGRGYGSKFALIAANISGTDQDKEHLARTERKAFIFYKGELA